VKVKLAKRAPYFNRSEAQKAYDWVMKNYDEACAVLPMILFERVQNEIFDHHDTIQKALDVTFEPEVTAIAKAYGADPENRDRRGRFARQESRSRTIRYEASARKPRKFEAPANDLKGPAAAKYAQAYQQVADEINALILDPEFDTGDAFVTAVYRDRRTGNVSTEQHYGLNPDKIVDPAQFSGNKDLVAINVKSSPPLSVAGAGYDLVTGLSDPATAARIGGGVEATRRAGEKLKQPGVATELATGRASGQVADDTTTTRAFNRLRAASDLATTVMGPDAPAKLRLAAATASFVGEYGPEAEKVLGPPTRRASYRYRGTEKRPDPALQQAVNDAIRAHSKDTDGGSDAEARTKARYATIYGWKDARTGRHMESPLISYFQSRLPDPSLYELQVKSGTLPPSQGVIIDRHGRVSHEAVGYGEDWYLPFNLKNLSALKGGEYVRTRAYGGLTTEDIYTGLVSGARSVTVVSNSGVFTVEFDDSFRGGRRLNDKAARMVGRYGYLLDAVKNGEVTPGEVDGRVKAEIKAAVADRYDPVDEPKRYQDEVDRREKKWMLSPTVSAAERAELTTAVLDEAAATWAADQGYAANNVEEVVAHERASIAARFGPELAQDQVSRRFGTPEAQAATFGAEKAVEGAIAAREREMREQVTPLRLDGVGYKYAQDALAEQFPYYIARKDARSLNRRGDRGYVKPRFNRPAAAQSGYYDDSIEGRGKVSADRTAYQNYGVRRAEKPVVEDTKDEAKPEAKAEAKPLASEGLAQRTSLLEAAAAVRNASKVSDQARGTANGIPFAAQAGKGVSAPDTKSALARAFPSIYDPEIETKISDPAFRTKLVAEFRALDDAKAFDVDLAAALSGGKAKPKEWSIEDALAGGGGQNWSFPDFDVDKAGSDPRVAAEYLSTLRDEDKDIAHALRRLDLEDATGDALIKGLASGRAAAVSRYLALDQQAVNAKNLPSKYDPPKDADYEDVITTIRGIDKMTAAIRKESALAPAPVSGRIVGPDEVEVKDVYTDVLAGSAEEARALGAKAEASGVPVMFSEDPADVIRRAGGSGLL
jgi:hypothetical protein